MNRWRKNRACAETICTLPIIFLRFFVRMLCNMSYFTCIKIILVARPFVLFYTVSYGS